MTAAKDDNAYLWDMLTAAQAVETFAQDRTVADYLGDLMLRSAVERQIEIIGEAEAAGKLHHTNIVPVYATGEEHGVHFYAMELVEGPSLDQVVKQLRKAVTASTTRKYSAQGTSIPYRTTEPVENTRQVKSHCLPIASRWISVNGRMPRRASLSIACNCSSENVDSSPVPWTSTNWPPPVMITFMSTLAAAKECHGGPRPSHARSNKPLRCRRPIQTPRGFGIGDLGLATAEETSRHGSSADTRGWS